MQQNQLQMAYVDQAPIYLAEGFNKNTDLEVMFIIKELGLKPGDQVLDIGCGVGRHSLGLAKAGINMTGIDLSPDMLKIGIQLAQEQKLDIKFVQGDASQVRLLDKKYDNAILIYEGAFCLYEDGVDPFKYHMDILNNINAMLKPKGKLLITVLNAFSIIRSQSDKDIQKGLFDPENIACKCIHNLKDGSQAEVWEKGFFPSELRNMLKLAGFEVKHLWGGTTFGWNKKQLLLDENEIMVISEKTDDVELYKN